jgi:hypothetical protein
MLRRAHLYFAENRPAILAALHYNGAGIYYEQESPGILTEWRDPVVLATAARAALQRFSFRECNLRNAQRSECPSYLASRICSIREFERLYLRITLDALNEAELFYDASAEPHGETDLALHTSLNRHGDDSEFGRKLLRLFDSCSAWAP